MAANLPSDAPLNSALDSRAGKSTLLREIRERAVAEGFTAFVTRGAELERGFSFGVVRQLFEAHVSSVSEEVEGEAPATTG
jgi:hypothetical protein